MFSFYTAAIRLINTGVRKSFRKRVRSFQNDSSIQTRVISYPKSGRTWLRTMLNDLGIYPKFDHAQANDLYEHNARFIPDSPSTAIPSDIGNKEKIVLLLRDPRDILVSSFFEATKRQHIFSGTISEFIRDEEFGIVPLLKFHNQWIETARQSANYKIEQYEDLRAHTLPVLDRIVRFLSGTHLPEKRLAATIRAFSFESMKRMEKSGLLRAFYGKKLKAGNTRDNESYKVRKGKTGGYTEYFSSEDIEYCTLKLRNNHPFYPQNIQSG